MERWTEKPDALKRRTAEAVTTNEEGTMIEGRPDFGRVITALEHEEPDQDRELSGDDRGGFGAWAVSDRRGVTGYSVRREAWNRCGSS
jgi:hypothetical protein